MINMNVAFPIEELHGNNRIQICIEDIRRGDRFINGFSYCISMRWQFHSVYTQILMTPYSHESNNAIKNTTHTWIAHYNDVIIGTMASLFISLSLSIGYSTVYTVADQRKSQSSASLAFVRGIHLWPVNSPHKWPVTRKMFPFDDVIMIVKTPPDRTDHIYNERLYIYIYIYIYQSTTTK